MQYAFSSLNFVGWAVFVFASCATAFIIKPEKSNIAVTVAAARNTLMKSPGISIEL
jgi:hypothetical protein